MTASDAYIFILAKLYRNSLSCKIKAKSALFLHTSSADVPLFAAHLLVFINIAVVQLVCDLIRDFVWLMTRLCRCHIRWVACLAAMKLSCNDTATNMQYAAPSLLQAAWLTPLVSLQMRFWRHLCACMTRG